MMVFAEKLAPQNAKAPQPVREGGPAAHGRAATAQKRGIGNLG